METFVWLVFKCQKWLYVSIIGDFLGDLGTVMMGYQVSYLQQELYWICPFEVLEKVLGENNIRTQKIPSRT